MNKKIIFLACILSLLLIGCQVEEPKTESLAELQVAACNTAHDAKTCTTRLLEVGIVMPEQCCSQLNKCC